MSEFIQKKLLTGLVAALFSTCFVYATLTFSKEFNIIPYALYRLFSKGGIDENLFIISFNVILSFVIFFVLYKLLAKMGAR